MSVHQQILACHQQIKPYIHQTPVLRSQLLDEIVGSSLFFKCENFQKTGSFKMRGAAHAILQLSPEQRAKGVVTHSSGNFAQAVAFAAQKLGVKAYIVMPSNAPAVKKTAVKGYGGEVLECIPTIEQRIFQAHKIVQEKGATLLHPSNDWPVIIGQATAAYELLQEQSDLKVLVAPVGGGGLLAGTALSGHCFGKNCSTIAGEPLAVDDAFRSLQSGKIETNAQATTVADGLRTQLGDQNFPIIQQHVQQIVRVTEEEILYALRLLWERLKIVCEPSSAVAFAAVLKEKEAFKGKKIGLIISGGNVDIPQIAALLN
ncbi:MAG: pyridoxal-phosphate dependent enzyme [Aureispira sp.]